MTDLEKLTKLFDEFGIGYEIKKYKDDEHIYVVLYTGRAKIVGHNDFVSDYKFTQHGEFVNVAVFE